MKAIRWEDTKREIRELEPGWDAPDRVAERERSRAEMRAEQRGYQLAQLRKNAGLTQAQVAALMGVTQARVSQIEHGKITEVDAIRGYGSTHPAVPWAPEQAFDVVASFTLLTERQSRPSSSGDGQSPGSSASCRT